MTGCPNGCARPYTAEIGIVGRTKTTLRRLRRRVADRRPPGRAHPRRRAARPDPRRARARPRPLRRPRRRRRVVRRLGARRSAPATDRRRGSPSRSSAADRRARHLGAIVSAIADRHRAQTSGRRRDVVWLVGAGPGDPDLLTVKAARLLAAADVVVHDALVGDGVLALVPPDGRADRRRQAAGPAGARRS